MKSNPISLLHVPSSDSHKGENGRLLVIGGSRTYHGAPLFSLRAARRFVDLLYFFPAEWTPMLECAVATVPEAIPIESPNPESVECILFGIGLGNAHVDEKFLSAPRLVIDGDGLRKLPKDMPAHTLLTPHEGEFARLFRCKGTSKNVALMAREHGVTILKKDPAGDWVSNGDRTIQNKVNHVGLTKGGSGDALAGLAAAFMCKNPALESALSASYLLGKTAQTLSKTHTWAYCTSDVIESLPRTFCDSLKRY